MSSIKTCTGFRIAQAWACNKIKTTHHTNPCAANDMQTLEKRHRFKFIILLLALALGARLFALALKQLSVGFGVWDQRIKPQIQFRRHWFSGPKVLWVKDPVVLETSGGAVNNAEKFALPGPTAVAVACFEPKLRSLNITVPTFGW